jgi:hypothetical protein
MTVGAVIIAYLAIGAVFSLLFVRAVKVATDPEGRWSKRPDTEATVRAAERAVGGFPGGDARRADHLRGLLADGPCVPRSELEEAMTETSEEIRARHHDESGAMHYAVRDGSVWLCVQCRSVLGEFGQGMPVTAARLCAAHVGRRCARHDRAISLQHTGRRAGPTIGSNAGAGTCGVTGVAPSARTGFPNERPGWGSLALCSADAAELAAEHRRHWRGTR